MKIGKLYQIKKYFWMLYPSKDIAAAVDGSVGDRSAALVFTTAAYFSKRLNCNISYISPSIFCPLEKDGIDGIYCKVLTANGEIGWIVLDEWCKDDIEEVTV